ncbi:MAG: cytochrome b/b6 domain-containing protein [Betaproteobacteria bacterium]|nr:cytochrome b/b6 domain-containing protein [Betaproteobacteria bacterium]
MIRSILVWDLPTRVFHWSLAASFAVALITAESERFRDVHVVSGYLLLALIGFRLFWGLVGSRYARFASFVRGPVAAARYLCSLLTRHPDHHLGHNPAAAVAIVLLLLLGALTGLTGWMSFDDLGGEAVKELHEGLANAMLALVAIHVLGVIVSSWRHRENLARAMITGYKNGPAPEAIPRAHGIIAVLLVAALAIFGWNLMRGKLPSLLDPIAATAEKTHAKHHEDDD